MWSLTDDALLAGMVAGDPHAAAAFVGRFQRRVFGLAMTILSCDLRADQVSDHRQVDKDNRSVGCTVDVQYLEQQEREHEDDTERVDAQPQGGTAEERTRDHRSEQWQERRPESNRATRPCIPRPPSNFPL